MILAISGIALAVCSARYLDGARKFEAYPARSMQLVSETFDSQRRAAMKRNWYKPVKTRAIVSNVYQVSQRVWGSDESNLFAKDGWGFTRGKMTQYKFSFIGESKNCVIGFTHRDYFGYRTEGFGLDTSNGVLVGKPPAASYYEEDSGTVFVENVGKESDDVDWFIEYREGGHAEVYMTLNREPLGLAFNIPERILRKQGFAGNMRPLLRCKGTMNSDQGIVVTQYSPVVIPSIRPYAARRRPDGRNFKLRNPGGKLPEEIIQKLGNQTFPEDYSVPILVTDRMIQMNVDSIFACNFEFRRDGTLRVKQNSCWMDFKNVEEPHSSLKNYLSQFLEHSDRYERLPSGDFKLHSEKFGDTLVFNPSFVLKFGKHGLF